MQRHIRRQSEAFDDESLSHTMAGAQSTGRASSNSLSHWPAASMYEAIIACAIADFNVGIDLLGTTTSCSSSSASSSSSSPSLPSPSSSSSRACVDSRVSVEELAEEDGEGDVGFAAAASATSRRRSMVSAASARDGKM